MKKQPLTWFVMLILTAWALASLWAQPSSQAAEDDENNLIRNPGFEERFKKWYPGKGEIDSSERHSGDCSCKIEIKDDGGPLDWFGGYADPIKVEPNIRYRISAWIRGNDIHGGKGATVSWGERDEDGKTLNNNHISEGMCGTFPWTKVEKVIKTSAKADTLIIGAAFKAYGVVWYDDFSLTKVDGE